MAALVFSSEDALIVALRSARIRPITASTFKYWRVEGGGIGVELDKICSKAELEILTRSGAEPAKVPANAATARSFVELVRPHPVADPELDPTNIIFVAGEEKTLLDLAAELLRLGCDRQSHSLQQRDGADSYALLRASHPPYYTLAAATEKNARVRAFTPVAGTNGRVFIEITFQHPLAASISVPEHELRLLTREGELLAVADGPWTELYSALDVVLPEAPRNFTALALEHKLEVHLRLVRSARTEAPSFWVLRDNGIQAIDRLLAALPEDIAARYLFAVGSREAHDASKPVVLLKTRGGRGNDPSVDIPGEAYVPLLSLPNIYVPLGSAIEPPLRRERLRALFAPAADEIAWLVVRENQEFSVERILDSAFSPLSEWVEYIAHSSAELLEPWVRSATFELERFQSIGAEWSEAPPKPPVKEKAPEKEKTVPEKPLVQPAQTKQAAPKQAAAAQKLQEVDQLPSGPSLTADQAALAALEEKFVELEGPLDAQERVLAWQAIASARAAINDLDEAGLCFAHAIWEGGAAEAQAAINTWLDSERRAGPIAAMLQDSLQSERPRRVQVRRAAVVAIAANTRSPELVEVIEHRGALQVWLERHDAVLDTRTAWLANTALARLAGGDPLHLARTRDRLLGRIHSGLSLERDVPRFLRYLGGGKPRAGVHVDRLIGGLENFLGRFLNTARKRRAVEAPENLTRAYSFLEFSYGFARLGRAERARALRMAALAELPAKDPVHAFLRDAYSARIDQALEARPLETPWSQAITTALAALDSFSRYKVDRLRKASRVLEPIERIEDPHGAYLHGERPELSNLRSLLESGQLIGALQKLIEQQAKAQPEARARVLEGVSDFYARVPAHARELLERTLKLLEDVPETRRAILYQEALGVAGTLGETALVRVILNYLTNTVDRLKAEDCAAVAAEIGRSLRGIRRAGLNDQYASFLDRLSRKITADKLDARIQIAAAMGFIGDISRAKTILDEAHRQLEAGFKSLRDGQPFTPLLKAIRALANAWSQGTENEALRGLSRLEPLLANVSDSFNTNSHFCLSVIEMIDALVLGYASEDLALGDRGRRFLDEDEHMVRRRIHRDLAQKEGNS